MVSYRDVTARTSAWGLAVTLACCGGAAGVRAQAQEPGVLAEQLVAAMLQAGTRVRAGEGQGALGGARDEATDGDSDENATEAVKAALPPQTIYRYRDARGREVYTNSAEAVPVQERARAKVDLSHIDLHTELGGELNRRLEERYDRLASSPRCELLLKEASLGYYERMWEDYAPLLVCGGVLLLFVLFTPSALRRFGGPIWARTLMMAIPALAVGGVVTYSMRETGRALGELKQQAAPCEPGGFASLGAAPDAVLRRAALVRQLQSLVMPVPSTGELPPPPALQ
jgi:hypothetical protein